MATKKKPKASKQLVVREATVLPAMQDREFKIAGKTYKMKRLVTLPLLKHEAGQTRMLRIEVPFYVGKSVDEKKGPATLTTVINLETGEEMTYIVSAVLQKNLEEQYPDAKYVGKSFAVAKYAPPEGKRYSLFNIAEIEED